MTTNGQCCCSKLSHDVGAQYCFTCGKKLSTACQECGYTTAKHGVVYCALCGSKYANNHVGVCNEKKSHVPNDDHLKAFLFHQIDLGEELTQKHILVTALRCLFPRNNITFAGVHFSFDKKGGFVTGAAAQDSLDHWWSKKQTLDIISYIEHATATVRFVKASCAPQVNICLCVVHILFF